LGRTTAIAEGRSDACGIKDAPQGWRDVEAASPGGFAEGSSLRERRLVEKRNVDYRDRADKCGNKDAPQRRRDWKASKGKGDKDAPQSGAT
jgi:hypothetical protein